MPLRILLIVTDLYQKIGGGERVYRKIIEASPDIDFFYFRKEESEKALRPPNATALPLGIPRRLEALVPPPFPDYKSYALMEADRVAQLVAGMSFDIVDMADFHTFGVMLRSAFNHHHVQVGRIVLALHGNISESLSMEWGAVANKTLEQHMLERDQFEKADYIYGISPRYIRKWQATVDRPVHYIDPLCFIDRNADCLPVQTKPKDEFSLKPSLYCIGRTERRKGNDLFVELVRWINPEIFDKVAHIGSEITALNGMGSSYILKNIASARNISVPFLGPLNHNDLQTLFKRRVLVVLPVRYDTLNLVALEALFCGCPVAVSSEAGVCDYLDQNFPTLPYVKIDLENFYACVSALENVLRNYDAYRENLESRLNELLPRMGRKLDMLSVYQAALAASCREGESSSTLIPYRSYSTDKCDKMKTMIYGIMPAVACHRAKQMMCEGIDQLKKKLFRHYLVARSIRSIRMTFDVLRVRQRLGAVARSPEGCMKQLREKLEKIYDYASRSLFRCNFWLDIARLERILGNDLFAVTYELRLLRLLGRDVFGLLPQVVSTLKAKGFVQEAAAALSLYEDPVRAPEKVYAFLRMAEERARVKPKLPPERCEDKRNGEPKISIIVSMYNAAPKLNFFLNAITQQTLIRNNPEAVEFVLIDSGSPTNEREVIQSFWQEKPLNAVYARSAERETIQTAWNRGIQLSRAPYLVFLGVDETLYPDALAKLAAELDKDAAIDWVMGSSLVTEVDPRGVYKNDVMTYDRKGATQDLCYLETCYISYVGGMYRKSIHDRFGYYDGTFRGAGDTEFKSRVLPNIKVKFLPETLGLFLNYPDGRTTASPMAEIEDLRAWYIHRSPGGVRYAFEKRPIEDVYALLRQALGYRKSYCKHTSSDIEYAKYLADYLVERQFRAEGIKELADDLGRMLEILRSLELVLTPPKKAKCIALGFKAWWTFRFFQRKHRALLSGSAHPTYSVLNDNRYEQHSWLWKS
jgi:glycosyltransferase involved in cell wall biosynthesis